jgi:formate dehydrogenase iron-sulfur subunit
MSEGLSRIGILVDVTRCNGCTQCIDACVKANKTESQTQTACNPTNELSAQRWASILESPAGGYVRKFCRHCLQPACVSVCPVGAMVKTEEGAVLYDSKKCMGCRYCMMACPYGIPRYEWDAVAPLVRKCTLCYERVKDGGIPACVEACPQQVMTFGDRQELLSLAHQRLEQEKSKYLPVVYGEEEVGGTSVLYISHVPLDFLGFHGAPPAQPLPELTWAWLNKVPTVTLATGGLMTGLLWVIGRRIQAQEARNAKTDPGSMKV